MRTNQVQLEYSGLQGSHIIVVQVLGPNANIHGVYKDDEECCEGQQWQNVLVNYDLS
jgi:hypothetical protein